MEQFGCQYGLPTSHNNGSTKRANISKSFFCSYFLFAKWGRLVTEQTLSKVRVVEMTTAQGI